jgi:hypothetical protein
VLNFLKQEDSVLVSAHSSEDANAAGAGNLSKNLQTKAILYIYEKVPFRGSFNRYLKISPEMFWKSEFSYYCQHSYMISKHLILR